MLDHTNNVTTFLLIESFRGVQVIYQIINPKWEVNPKNWRQGISIKNPTSKICYSSNTMIKRVY